MHFILGLSYFQAIFLAVIEGLTEYLPVSSTGHIILGSSLLGIAEDPFVKDYTVIVQFGAIASVLYIYRDRFKKALKENFKATSVLMLASFIPTGAVGFLLNKTIDRLLGSVQTVGLSLFLGGLILLFVDRLKAKSAETDGLKIPIPMGIKIGFAQCLAMIPGVSRSGASIAAGMVLGLSRATAAEFSFFLAVPTLTAATAYKVMKLHAEFNSETISILVVGNLVSFLVGILAIRSFISFLQKKGFFWFGIYRVIVGLTILALLASGHSLAMD